MRSDARTYTSPGSTSKSSRSSASSRSARSACRAPPRRGRALELASAPERRADPVRGSVTEPAMSSQDSRLDLDSRGCRPRPARAPRAHPSPRPGGRAGVPRADACVAGAASALVASAHHVGRVPGARGTRRRDQRADRRLSERRRRDRRLLRSRTIFYGHFRSAYSATTPSTPSRGRGTCVRARAPPPPCVRRSSAPSRPGEHPAGERAIDRARPRRGVPQGGAGAPVPEDRRPMARPRALGDHGRGSTPAPRDLGRTVTSESSAGRCTERGDYSWPRQQGGNRGWNAACRKTRRTCRRWRPCASSSRPGSCSTVRSDTSSSPASSTTAAGARSARSGERIDGASGGFLVSPDAIWAGSEMVRSVRSAQARGWTIERIYAYWQAHVGVAGRSMIDPQQHADTLFQVARRVGAPDLAGPALLPLVPGDEHVARLASLGRADEPPLLHQVHQPPGARSRP